MEINLIKNSNLKNTFNMDLTKKSLQKKKQIKVEKIKIN